jgi:hypothetical protein
MIQDVGHNLLEDSGVTFQEVQSSLSRLLIDPSRDYDYFAPGQVTVTTSAHPQWMRERHRVANIVGFSPRARFVPVHQNNLAPHAPQHQGEGSR